MKKVALLLWLLGMLNAGYVLGQWQQPVFTRLSTNEGLSQGFVHAILKDSRGFMWFATDEGLNKYDGYKFTVYKHTPGNPASIRHNRVYDILEDKAGTIWVATAGGLDAFDAGTETFSHYTIGRTALDISDIFQDSQQRLWLGTTTGLYRLDMKNKAFSRYAHRSADAGSLSNNTVVRITEDRHGMLWVGTQNGLNRFDPVKQQFQAYFHDPANPASLSSSWIKTVYTDPSGTLWAGTLGGGICRFDPASSTFTAFRHNPADPNSIGYDDILSFVEDDRHNLWVGTENGGISVYNPTTNRFVTFGNDPADDSSLSSNSVYCLYKDDIGNVWAGTYSGGVNFRPRFGRKFRTFRNSPFQSSLSNNIILAIKGDATGIVWLGTDGGGLNRFDPKTSTFTAYKKQSPVGNSPNSDFIITVIEVEKNILALGYHRGGFDLFDTGKNVFTHYVSSDHKNDLLATYSVNAMGKDHHTNLWIGTWAHGLYYYNRFTKQTTHFLHDAGNPNSLCDNNLNTILEDETGAVWVGTENGLDRFDWKTGLFAHFKEHLQRNPGFSSNTINCLLNDGAYLWIGSTGGICRLHKKTGHVDLLTEKDGLPNGVINAMTRDDHGNFWISTNKGISRYAPKGGTFRNYGLSDGIQGNEFKPGSAYKMADGTLLFGGTEGLNVFHPDSMQDNTYVPPVYITDFQIFNKSVYAGEAGSPLSQHISQTHNITLAHAQDVFSIEFSALNYTLPQKNQYAFKLDGFDKEWSYIGTKRSATYTNLNRGNYVFRVKAANNDGLWNETGTSLALTILPPYWQTWWFGLLISSLIIGPAYAFYYVRINAIKAQKWALERIVDERTERLHQEQVLNNLKSQFVSTTSHEFRTPLATMQSSIELVKMYLDLPPEKGRSRIEKHLSVIEKQITRFIDLMDDILTIEKMNAGKTAFNPVPTDVVALCQTIVSTHFQHRKDDRRVDVQVIGTPCLLSLDEKTFSQALMNLLTNAFKFSAGNPLLQLTFGGQQLSLSVSDHGIGIPQQDLPHLFETFFRAGNATAIQGTGLGLFIIKQSIERHGGSVAVQSQENVGTTFTVTLPNVPVFSPGQCGPTAATAAAPHPGKALS